MYTPKLRTEMNQSCKQLEATMALQELRLDSDIVCEKS